MCVLDARHYPHVSWAPLAHNTVPSTDVLSREGPGKQGRSSGRRVSPSWGHPSVDAVLCSLQSPASCSSQSFPEMPVDQSMESTLELSRHQPHSSPPEVSFVVEVGSVP